MDFYNQIAINIVISIVSTLCSTFLLFFAGITIFFKPQVKISRKIAYGREFQTNSPAYRFKIVNKSYFITARDFEIHLFAIEKVKNEYDNTYQTTYHPDEFEIKYSALKNLETYKSNLMLFFIRRRNEKFSTPFDWRIRTYDNIKKHFPKYEALRLTISYTDSLNKRQFVIQDFDISKQIIFEGSFANNGSLNEIIPKVKIDDNI